MPLPNPKHPLSVLERGVFGHNAKRHPITGFPLEQGHGSLSSDAQAAQHVERIEADTRDDLLAKGADLETARREGREVANGFRRRLGIPIAEEVSAEAARIENARLAREREAYAALEAAEAKAAAETKAAAEAEANSTRVIKGRPLSMH